MGGLLKTTLLAGPLLLNPEDPVLEIVAGVPDSLLERWFTEVVPQHPARPLSWPDLSWEWLLSHQQELSPIAQDRLQKLRTKLFASAAGLGEGFQPGDRVEEALTVMEKRFEGNGQVGAAIADFRSWWVALELTESGRRFASRWPKSWSSLRSIKRGRNTIAFLAIQELSILKNNLAEGIRVYRDSTLPRVPTTEIVIYEGKPSAEDLQLLADVLGQLLKASPKSHRLVLDYTSVLKLTGEEEDMLASIMMGVPGWINFDFPFEGKTKEEKRDVLYGIWAQEAAHHRFVELWPEEELIAEESREFEFPLDQPSPLTNHLDPYSYLMEIDGYLFESAARLDLVRALIAQPDERKRVEDQLQWVARDLREIETTLGLFRSLSSPSEGTPEVLTARGKEQLSQLRQRWGALKVSLRLSQTAGLEETAAAARLFAEQARKEGDIRIVLGPTAFQVPGLAAAVQALREAGLKDRFIVLPGLPPDAPEDRLPDEVADQLFSLGVEVLSLTNPFLKGYADENDRVMQGFRDALQGFRVPFERYVPSDLTRMVRQILLDLGVPEATATTEAVDRFLALTGLEQAA